MSSQCYESHIEYEFNGFMTFHDILNLVYVPQTIQPLNIFSKVLIFQPLFLFIKFNSEIL